MGISAKMDADLSPTSGKEIEEEQYGTEEEVLGFASLDEIDFSELFSSYPLPPPDPASFEKPMEPMDVACDKLKWWRTFKKREPRKNSRKTSDDQPAIGQTSLDTCAMLMLMSDFFEQMASKMIASQSTRQDLNSNAHTDLFMNSVFVSINQMLSLLQIVPDLKTDFLEVLKQCMDNMLVVAPIA
ncbi:Zinc finger protein zas1 [Trichuris trichiura]|uniref:Zinc finger protein zas1 n=1 Tax=Trichuris trichiura TaxID=36087 RepID=A0A077ZAS6_TRITR|nr:Zinc finger protein zas1 [Trichuris trichiura]